MSFYPGERNTGEHKYLRENFATFPCPTTHDDRWQYSFLKIGDETVRIATTLVVSLVGVKCNTGRNTSGDIKRLLISLCIYIRKTRGRQGTLGARVSSIHNERLALVGSLHL